MCSYLYYSVNSNFLQLISFSDFPLETKMKITIKPFSIICLIFLLLACTLSSCTKVEDSAGRAFGNANSAIRSSSDTMWSPAAPKAAQEKQVKEDEERNYCVETPFTLAYYDIPMDIQSMLRRELNLPKNKSFFLFMARQTGKTSLVKAAFDERLHLNA
jgi:hypothetical protein